MILNFKSMNPFKASLIQTKIAELVELLENPKMNVQDIVHYIFKDGNITIKDIEKTNKIIVKKYGKNNVEVKKLPVNPDCEFAKTAHNQCICLCIYFRPKIYLDDETSDEFIVY